MSSFDDSLCEAQKLSGMFEAIAEVLTFYRSAARRSARRYQLTERRPQGRLIARNGRRSERLAPYLRRNTQQALIGASSVGLDSRRNIITLGRNSIPAKAN